MKGTKAILMITAILMILTGCKKQETVTTTVTTTTTTVAQKENNPFVGTWESDDTEITLKEDGTLQAIIKEESLLVKGEYEADENSLRVFLDFGSVGMHLFEGKIENGDLLLWSPSKSEDIGVYKKKAK